MLVLLPLQTHSISYLCGKDAVLIGACRGQIYLASSRLLKAQYPLRYLANARILRRSLL